MGTLFVVGTPIGNLEDLSFRAQRILSEADIIAAEDTRHTKILLDHYNINTPLTSYHKFNVRAKTDNIVDMMKRGRSVALVSDAGMPGISDPGYELIKGAIKGGIEVTPIPGPSAGITALSVSGLTTDRFCFEGYLPKKKGERVKKLKELKSEDRTIILYEAPHRLLESLGDIRDVFGDRMTAIGRELKKKFEEVVCGDVSEVMSHFMKKKPRGEFVIIIEGNKEKEVNITEAAQLAKEMIKSGISKKDASKIVSKFFDVPKNTIYKELI